MYHYHSLSLCALGCATIYRDSGLKPSPTTMMLNGSPGCATIYRDSGLKRSSTRVRFHICVNISKSSTTHSTSQTLRPFQRHGNPKPNHTQRRKRNNVTYSKMPHGGINPALNKAALCLEMLRKRDTGK